jgi:hypothetical protein
MIIFILALTAIGWFVSRIDTASNSGPATTTISETMPAPTESAPTIPLARPKLDGDDAATVLAASTTPTGRTPPKPLAKPELYDDDATTGPASEATPTSSQEAPPIPPAKPELYGDDTTTVLAAETTPASTTELADVGMETSPAIETTTAPTTNTTPDMLANFVDYVERRFAHPTQRSMSTLNAEWFVSACPTTTAIYVGDEPGVTTIPARFAKFAYSQTRT